MHLKKKKTEEKRGDSLLVPCLLLLQLALVKVVHLTCNGLCIATSLIHRVFYTIQMDVLTCTVTLDQDFVLLEPTVSPTSSTLCPSSTSSSSSSPSFSSSSPSIPASTSSSSSVTWNSLSPLNFQYRMA